MFGNKKNSQMDINVPTSSRTATTIISSGSDFNGTLNASGIVRIDGVFSGDMNIDGSLIIGESGCIKGNIKAEKVTIAGKVEGNIYLEGTLELASSGRLFGDIEIKGINITDGAIFQGKCIMIKDNELTAREPAAPEEKDISVE